MEAESGNYARSGSCRAQRDADFDGVVLAADVAGGFEMIEGGGNLAFLLIIMLNSDLIWCIGPFMDDNRTKKVEVDPQWKTKAAANLKNLGVISPEFTGKLIINCNQGGITEITYNFSLK